MRSYLSKKEWLSEQNITTERLRSQSIVRFRMSRICFQLLNCGWIFDSLLACRILGQEWRRGRYPIGEQGCHLYTDKVFQIISGNKQILAMHKWWERKLFILASSSRYVLQSCNWSPRGNDLCLFKVKKHKVLSSLLSHNLATFSSDIRSHTEHV